MHFASEQFGPPFSYPPGERRKLPSESALLTYLSSLTLSPLGKRPTLDTAVCTSPLGLEEGLSLGLSFRKVGDEHLPANITLFEEHHSLHIGANSWICGERYPRILSQFANAAHTAEYRKIIELLRANEYVHHGPEATLYKEIAERKEQYPDFSPMLFISPSFLFYLSNTRPMAKDSLRPAFCDMHRTDVLASLHAEFEGCQLIVEQCQREYVKDGLDSAENLRVLRDFEFAVLARPQIETKFRYEYLYTTNRMHRAWKVEINLHTWLDVALLARKSRQTPQDKVKHILAKDASRFLNIDHEFEV